MQSGEGDHPLRADPLQALPDAVLLPRRPNPRLSAQSTSHVTKSVEQPSKPSVPFSSPQSSSFDQRIFQENALALLRSPTTDDPLISAIGEENVRPPSPPAGHAYATNMHEALTAIEDPRDDRDGPPLAAGIVDRSDVTLLPDEPKKGSAAGVYIVRSRRNWAFNSPHNPGSSSSPLPNQSVELEYYHVRRSIADFVWLEDRLRTRNEGIIVPPLPSMAFAGRLNYGYAYDAQRLRGLERFLRRVATHAVLSTGEDVLSFLGATGEEVWQKLRKEPIIHESAVTTVLFGGPRGSDDASAVQRMSRWSEKMLWQAGRKLNKGVAWFLERDSPSDGRRKEDSAEARLERLQTYVTDLNVTLAAVRVAAGKVATSRNQEIRGVTSLQHALHELAQREGGKFGALLESVILDISEQCEVGTNSTSIPPDRMLEEVFGDYEERANGAQRIMNARREEQDAYEHALAVYTRLRDKLESRTGSMWETVPTANTNGEGMEELVGSVTAASNRLVDVRKHYQGVAISTTDELRRLRMDMHDEICDALRGIAVEYARQHRAHSAAWTAFAERMQLYLQPSPEE